jgi:hypothetical protein
MTFPHAESNHIAITNFLITITVTAGASAIHSIFQISSHAVAMRTVVLFSLVLHFLFWKTIAQNPISSSATATVSLTPAMSSSSVASYYSSLATSAPIQPGTGPSAGDAGSSGGTSVGDSDAGASGSDSGSITLSQGGMIAIIVMVVAVSLFGIASAVLYYLAKKRSWEVRKSIRRSARKVATALTPRRSTFRKDVRRSTKGLARIDEVPPTPRTRSGDVEKGNSKLTEFEMEEPPKQSKWARKLGR